MDDIPEWDEISAEMAAELTIEELLQRWPAAIHVIQELRLACLGCAFAPFCTVAEAATLHGFEPHFLRQRLNKALMENKKNE